MSNYTDLNPHHSIDYIRATFPRNINAYGDTNTFLRIIFVLLSRVGFLLIQLGSIPVQNVYRIIFFNIFEIGNTIISYISLGYMITFGDDTIRGIIGYTNNYFKNIDEGLLGICACLLGSAQISCFLIGRVHVITNIFTIFLYCGFYQPLLAHWIWNKEGWMKKFTILKTKVSVKDYGGDLVIHLSSSLIGIIGAMFLGRRLVKVKELDERSMAREFSGHTVIGYTFIAFGYVAFNLPSQDYKAMKMPRNYIEVILLNNAAAFSTGILLVSLLNMCIFRHIFSYWAVIRCLQGGIAAIISVAAAVDIYTYFESMAIAAVSSVLFFFFSILIHNTSLEDNCNVIASHFVSSIFGTIACPIIARKENFDSKAKKVHILWQLICLLVVMACTIVFSWFVFLCLAICRLLRSKEEIADHKRAVNVAKYLPKKGCMQRLFMIDCRTEHIAPGDVQRQRYTDES